MKNFRTFQIAADFYRCCQQVALASELKGQLLRASSSVALNLAEGRGKPSRNDQLRFFNIAMGSARESQGILILGNLSDAPIGKLADHLGASLYLLIKRAR